MTEAEFEQFWQKRFVRDIAQTVFPGVWRLVQTHRLMDHTLAHGADCCIGMNLDGAAITEPERFLRCMRCMRCMRESFDEIMALSRPAAGAR